MKKKILLSAFACDPLHGSEPYVGWNWTKILSDSYDVHVITREVNKKLIIDHPINNKVTFHYFDLGFAKDKWHYWKFIKPYYVVWQMFVVYKVRKLNKQHNYEIMHHVTYNNIDVPGMLWMVSKKFVWGPVGGGQVPPSKLKQVYVSGWWKQKLRWLLKLSSKYNPVIRLALRKSSLVLVANSETAKLIGNKCKQEKMLETAIWAEDILSSQDAAEKASHDGVKRLLWIGRIEERKALGIALDALRKVEADDIVLDVVGDGPLQSVMEKYAVDIGVKDKVCFHGRVDFSQVRDFYRQAYAFLFTSVQDTSGNVILESMSNGVPVIALNHQGAKEIIKETTGILVDLGSYDEVVDRFAEKIIYICEHGDVRDRYADESILHIRKNHTWEVKKEIISARYDEMIYENA